MDRGWHPALLLLLVLLLVVSRALAVRLRRTQPRMATVVFVLPLVPLGLAVWRCPRPWDFAYVFQIMYGLVLGASSGREVFMVWWKRRLQRQGGPMAAFWQDVDDDYWWRGHRTASKLAETSAELEAAEAPTGLGTEPEASRAYPDACSEGDPTSRGGERAEGAARSTDLQGR